MSKANFLSVLAAEVKRIDDAKTAKRFEKIITGFSHEASPKAIISGKQKIIFNSNDYLGLRFNKELSTAEEKQSKKFGTGPGAVRFISGTLVIHQELEKALAKFHGRDAAMVFSSAFATNLAVLFCLLKGQSKDSLVGSEVLVISDALNHRSIIDGIRLANLSDQQKQIFKHLDDNDLDRVLKENLANFKRVVVVTDGVFSMLGEFQNLKKIKQVIEKYDPQYPEGILLVVDDSHGVAACGKSGKGVEEVFQTQADVLIGTLGKGFGADGGYVVANQPLIDYLRESSATYIYSNSISPGTAGAALAAVKLLSSAKGKKLLDKLQKNIAYFQKIMANTGVEFAASSTHPIQPLLIGDPLKTKELVTKLLEKGVLATAINYPVVPKGRDEIRVQISARHTKTDLGMFAKIIGSLL